MNSSLEFVDRAAYSRTATTPYIRADVSGHYMLWNLKILESRHRVLWVLRGCCRGFRIEAFVSRLSYRGIEIKLFLSKSSRRGEGLKCCRIQMSKR
jgi:hypothetical protein